ncbi:MAG: hypothetical protein Q7K55_08750 [Candidatus Levybacteria bacterium]|nr:hypothetical protein [Candidatus Levybacteria bacterium]
MSNRFENNPRKIDFLIKDVNSQHEKIRKELSSNPDIFVAGYGSVRYDRLFLPVGEPHVEINKDRFAEHATFLVAPRDGEFDPNRLEEFRQKLFPALTPAVEEKTRIEQNGDMIFGYSAFDEVSAEKIRTVVMVVPHPLVAIIIKDIVLTDNFEDKIIKNLEFGITEKQLIALKGFTKNEVSPYRAFYRLYDIAKATQGT